MLASNQEVRDVKMFGLEERSLGDMLEIMLVQAR
jgi:hypothetical protein